MKFNIKNENLSQLDLSTIESMNGTQATWLNKNEEE